MKIFVDCENVRSLGFIGAEHLTPEDEVILFYSQFCETLERGIMDKLYDSGCTVSRCKLQRTGRNALDFYITSHIGEVLGKGYSGTIAIVSHDKGFQAIYDYWKARNPDMMIVCGGNIAHCIMHSGEDSIRRKKVCNEHHQVNIEKEFARFEKRDRLKASLAEALRDSGKEWQIDRLTADLMEMETGRETYLSLMRTYGIMDGQTIYQALRKAS